MSDPNQDDVVSPNCLLRYVARVVIELETPLHVGTGREWDESDAGVVLDANGLPAIPGSSIAGVLRDACGGGGGEEVANSLFGYQRAAGRGGRGEGQGSRLSISWACIHDQDDRPVFGLKDIIDSDRVLNVARAPTLRDHVRIGRSGTVASRCKFDELVVHAGHRFTFELELVGRPEDEADWGRLIALLQDPVVRFGGKVRRGLGRFRVERLSRRCFDLTKIEDFDAYRRMDGRISEAPLPGVPWEAPQPGSSGDGGGVEALRLKLRPRFFWMFGGGGDSEADMAPVRDHFIAWKKREGQADQGTPEERFYLPGSSIKGALRHRTLFHACAFVGCFADRPDWRDKLKGAEAMVRDLFGEQIPEGERDDRDTPCARGRVFIDDVFLEGEPGTLLPSRKDGFLAEPHLQHHVGIDRFIGGAREALLFTEKPLFQRGPIAIVIHLRGEVDPSARQAFDMALDDLCQGRLPLGGGAGRGLGYFDGERRKEEAHAS